jgi:hypothetical protein
MKKGHNMSWDDKLDEYITGNYGQDYLDTDDLCEDCEEPCNELVEAISSDIELKHSRFGRRGGM